jgi:hypothetical protein
MVEQGIGLKKMNISNFVNKWNIFCICVLLITWQEIRLIDIEDPKLLHQLKTFNRAQQKIDKRGI